MRPLASPLQGDPAYRITVPLPPSLKVLNDCAQKHFGHPGRLNLYHKGAIPILRDQQLAQLQDGDLIVITWDDRRLSEKEVASLSSLVTTYATDYAIPARTASPARRPPEPSEPYVPYRVTEQTSYKSGYVRYPIEECRFPCSPRDMFPVRHVSTAETGRSSYADEFSRPEAPYRPRGMRRSDEPWKPSLFEGETTYKVMHTLCSADPAGPPSRHWASPKTAGPPVKFEGTSTYRAHFNPQRLEKGRKGHSDVSDDQYTPHRLGKDNSEYRSEYVEREIVSARVHLEPELGKMAPVS
jgi:hypothetical protein